MFQNGFYFAFKPFTSLLQAVKLLQFYEIKKLLEQKKLFDLILCHN
jgi:hypothetical protein